MSIPGAVLTVNSELDMISLMLIGISCNEVLREQREYDIYSKVGADKRGANEFKFYYQIQKTDNYSRGDACNLSPVFDNRFLYLSGCR